MSQTRAQLLKGFSNTSAPDDAILVNSSGNVAIGTTTASTRLDVEGNNIPLEVNSANSNGNKVQFSDAGTVRGFFGASSSASFLVSGDGGSEQFRVQAAGGISFNGDTAAVNALDDYEEGTWSSTVSGITATTNSVTGEYTKIGNAVFINGFVHIAGKTAGSGNVNFNLPFQPLDTSTESFGMQITRNTIDTSYHFVGPYNGGGSTFFYNHDMGAMTGSIMGNGVIAFNGSYITNT